MPPELDYALSDRENAALLSLADANGLSPEAMAAELTRCATSPAVQGGEG